MIKVWTQSYYEKLKSDSFEKLQNLSNSMKVKRGLWPRSCREVSLVHKSATNGRDCALATTLWTTRNYTEAPQGRWVSETIRARRLRLAGLCAHHNGESASKVLFWEPQHGASIEADLNYTLTPSRPTLDWTIVKNKRWYCTILHQVRDDSQPK